MLNWLELLLKFVQAKIVHVFLFIVVNVVIGSLGVWMPMLTSLLLENVQFKTELSKGLAASGPYTFAVAYLAASTAFVAFEYLEERPTVNRKLKTTLTTTAFVLIILCTLFSAFQTLIPEMPKTNSSASELSAEVSKQQTQVTNNATQSSAQQSKNKALSASEILQLWLVVAAIIVGLLLYLISRCDDEDVIRMVAEHELSTNKAAQQLGNMAFQNNQPAGTLKL